jgi:(S)-3,5-dihydroxyphenylglycine transaminase
VIHLPPVTLHGSLRDPLLGSISFLNEVMSRYPQAVSFAPGAPHPRLFEGIEPQRYVDRYLDHLIRDKGMSPDRARRLLFEYGPSRGLINDLVADALRRDHGIDAPADALVVTVGAQEALLLVLRALFGSPSDLLAVVSPCFSGITGAARLLDIDVVGVEETTQGVDLDALEAACVQAQAEGRRVRACYVAADFSNPGGVRMPLAVRQRLLRLARAKGFLVLEDNAYGFTAPPGHELPPLKALDRSGHVVHIGTFAKICFPGARVGYVVADQRTGSTGDRTLADELAAIKSMVTVNTSPLCQAVIGGMLLEHHGSLAEVSRAKATLYRHNLAHLVAALGRHLGDELPAVTWNRPEGGFFVTMNLPVIADRALLEVSAATYGVLWTPMSPFHLTDAGDRRLRLSCSYLEPREIETGVQRLATFLKKEIAS